MKCWNCGTVLDDPPRARVPFRATCDACNSWLHCCKNCEHYKPGLPNDCAFPGTETIADREGSNLCEEFDLKGVGPEKKAELQEISHRLFGKDEEDLSRPSFNDLFDHDS